LVDGVSLFAGDGLGRYLIDGSVAIVVQIVADLWRPRVHPQLGIVTIIPAARLVSETISVLVDQLPAHAGAAGAGIIDCARVVVVTSKRVVHAGATALRVAGIIGAGVLIIAVEILAGRAFAAIGIASLKAVTSVAIVTSDDLASDTLATVCVAGLKAVTGISVVTFDRVPGHTLPVLGVAFFHSVTGVGIVAVHRFAT
jgi:hypothetical protein